MKIIKATPETVSPLSLYCSRVTRSNQTLHSLPLPIAVASFLYCFHRYARFQSSGLWTLKAGLSGVLSSTNDKYRQEVPGWHLNFAGRLTQQAPRPLSEIEPG